MTKQQIKKVGSSFSGFTLVELIVVISIIAILWTIAFVSIGGYMSSSRDSKRISNASIISKGLDVAIAQGLTPNTEKTATGYNIQIVGSGGAAITMTGYYGVVNEMLLRSIKIMGNDIATFDGFQEYRYSYFPKERKYQILSTLENPENARIVFDVSNVLDKAFAYTGAIGYPYIKGNFTATGGISSIMVDGATWTTKTPVNGIKEFPSSETIQTTAAIPVAPATTMPMNGECGNASNTPSTVIPTASLCSIGTATGMVTNMTDANRWTWGCTGVNGGKDLEITSCHADYDTSYHCVFDDPSNKSKFGDGTTTYCTFSNAP